MRGAGGAETATVNPFPGPANRSPCPIPAPGRRNRGWIRPPVRSIMPARARSNIRKSPDREVHMTASKWVGLVVVAVVLTSGGLALSRALAADPPKDGAKGDAKADAK